MNYTDYDELKGMHVLLEVVSQGKVCPDAPFYIPDNRYNKAKALRVMLTKEIIMLDTLLCRAESLDECYDKLTDGGKLSLIPNPINVDTTLHINHVNKVIVNDLREGVALPIVISLDNIDDVIDKIPEARESLENKIDKLTTVREILSTMKEMKNHDFINLTENYQPLETKKTNPHG